VTVGLLLAGRLLEGLLQHQLVAQRCCLQHTVAARYYVQPHLLHNDELLRLRGVSGSARSLLLMLRCSICMQQGSLCEAAAAAAHLSDRVRQVEFCYAPAGAHTLFAQSVLSSL
jgi:hypothetical protein